MIIDYFKNQYKRFCTLYKATKIVNQSKNLSEPQIYLQMIIVVFKKLKINFFQYLNQNVILGKDEFTVQYMFNDKIYKMVVKPQRGRKHTYTVTDEDGNDMTNEISVYAGLSNNFHGMKYTPKFFGKKRLIFNIGANKTEKIYEENDILQTIS